MANVKWFGAEFQKFIDAKLDVMMEECGAELASDIRENFTDPGDWKKYKSRSTYKKTHWSSKPFQPPAVDTWKLKMSIDYELYKTGWERRIRVGTKVKYGLWMEKGTPKILPRPFLRPAIHRYKPRFLTKIKSLGI